jgi:transcriptional regulator of acetoin/glycerol metabolism
VTPLESAEAAVIAAMLSECNGNKSAAAGRLGISRATLYSKLRRYRIGTPGQIPLPR